MLHGVQPHECEAECPFAVIVISFQASSIKLAVSDNQTPPPEAVAEQVLSQAQQDLANEQAFASELSSFLSFENANTTTGNPAFVALTADEQVDVENALRDAADEARSAVNAQETAATYAQRALSEATS